MDHALNEKKELALAADSPNGKYFCKECGELANRRGESVDHRIPHFYHKKHNPDCSLSVADQRGSWGPLTSYWSVEYLKSERPDYQMQGKVVTIVGLGVHAPSFLNRMEKVFHIPQANWISTIVQKYPSPKANHVLLLKAYADQINIGQLFE